MNPHDDYQLYEFCMDCSVEDFRQLVKNSPDAKVLENKQAILGAAMIGNIELLHYFFTSPETQTYHSTYNDWLDEIIAYTAQGGRVEPIRYLCTSPDLSKKPDLSYKNHDAFKTACTHEDVDLVHFFLTQKIAFTPDTEDWLATTPYAYIYDEAKMLFDIETNFQTLKNKLDTTNQSQSVKRKI